MPWEVSYVCGNTYKVIPRELAALDRSGRYRKVHDWTLFVDVTAGNPDIIQQVTFDLGRSFQPSSFTCSCPVKVTKGASNNIVWRFSTRQQSYGFPPVSISILGAGGSRQTISYRINSERAHHQIGKKKFVEEHSINQSFSPQKISPEQKFGIELELTTNPDDPAVTLEAIASSLTNKLRGRFGRISVIQNYGEGRRTTNVWKMVPDSSIVCNLSSPNCTTFELVSPVLAGVPGLQQATQVLTALSRSNSLQVNKSMGFHVHVDVSALSLDDLIKVCQNFIKYENVMDTFMPVSRRNGNPECERFFRSNTKAMADAGFNSNKSRHEALGRCQTKEQLAQRMNPSGRYYKLNLQNLVSGRQPTLEFRQHSATTNSRKVDSWVRFCVAMVRNSVKLKAPKNFKSGRDVDFQFEALFQYLIKDRSLRDFYRRRQQDLLSGEDDDDTTGCCSNCANGLGCARNN